MPPCSSSRPSANSELKSANLDLDLANRRVRDSYRDLQLANERERARFDLALEAIKTFHSGVSEDVLLKEKQFDGLRTKLLGGATAFYNRLEDLLKTQADRRSRAALGQAYHDIGELTARIGSQTEALAALRRGLELRLALASEPGASDEAKTRGGLQPDRGGRRARGDRRSRGSVRVVRARAEPSRAPCP